MKLVTIQWIPLIGIPALVIGMFSPDREDNIFYGWNNGTSLILNALLQALSTYIFIGFLRSL